MNGSFRVWRAYSRGAAGLSARWRTEQRIMSKYRLEATLDPSAGKYYAQLYYPAEATEPIARTLAIYDSEAEALQRVEQIFRAATAITDSAAELPPSPDPAIEPAGA